MKFESHRVGEYLFEIDEKINNEGSGTFSRQIRAITTFDIPHTNICIHKGAWGGYLECDEEGKILPIVSRDSWIEDDSWIGAGTLIDKSFVVNSDVFRKAEGGEYIYSNTYYRKSYVINSVVISSDICGETIVNDFVLLNETDNHEQNIESHREKQNAEITRLKENIAERDMGIKKAIAEGRDMEELTLKQYRKDEEGALKHIEYELEVLESVRL